MRADSSRPTFGARVRAWRSARGISQRALEAAIGKNRGYVTHLENGKFIPPPRAVCDALADHLGIDRDEVWIAAVDERLRGLDKDLFAVYSAAVEGMPDVREDERRLIEVLRRIDARHGGERSVTPSLLRLANLLATQFASADGVAVVDPDEVLRALFQLDDCSHRTVSRVMEVLVGVVDVVGLEREHLGFSRE